MTIQDKEIEWERKRIYVGAPQFSSLVTNATGGIFAGAGDVILGEISTFGLAAARLEATTDLVLDARPMPVDLDVRFPVYLRVFWSSDSATAADDATMLIRYNAKADQETVAAPTTALNTTIAEDRLGGQYFLCRTSWGEIDADTLTDGDVLGLELSCSATDADIANEYIWLIGYEMEYTPKRTEGLGLSYEASTPHTT